MHVDELHAFSRLQKRYNEMRLCSSLRFRSTPSNPPHFTSKRHAFAFPQISLSSITHSLSRASLIIRVIHRIMPRCSPSLIKQIFKIRTRCPPSRSLRQIQRARAQMHAVLGSRAQRRAYTWTIRRGSAETLRADRKSVV